METMTKRKVSELEGAWLDYWVARANGLKAGIEYYATNPPKGHTCWLLKDGKPDHSEPYAPSTNWAQGGPIIEREGIATFRYTTPSGHYWRAVHPIGTCGYGDGEYIDIGVDEGNCGFTPLIAAMRCFVTSKFGEEVGE